jgi:hypothetical protein
MKACNKLSVFVGVQFDFLSLKFSIFQSAKLLQNAENVTVTSQKTKIKYNKGATKTSSAKKSFLWIRLIEKLLLKATVMPLQLNQRAQLSLKGTQSDFKKLKSKITFHRTSLL